MRANEETLVTAWLRQHRQYCVEPLLAEPWILDVEPRWPVCGHQEGAAPGPQCQESGASEPLLSHLFYDFGARRRDRLRSNEHTPSMPRQGLLAWSIACHATCGRRCCAATAVSATRGHARGGADGSCLSPQAAPDRQRQTQDREARLGAPMAQRRPRLRGEGERGSADGLESAAAIDRAAPAAEGCCGGWRWERQLRRDEEPTGLGGFTTYDLARCRLAAPLSAIAPRTRHQRQTTIRVATSPAKPKPAAEVFARQSPGSCEAWSKTWKSDRPANMAGDPFARLPGLPHRPPAPRGAAPCAKLTQRNRKKTLSAHPNIGRLPLLDYAGAATSKVGHGQLAGFLPVPICQPVPSTDAPILSEVVGNPGAGEHLRSYSSA